ncbi:serine hydrolase domain-containing protein [Aestuariibius sp. 2305UL40-4]|uniref:serine hydrolase domain-containing protein n=1 Tax=Aestuariibius violaceus TaxID=3234132 RepID=UPI00345EB893
MRLVLGFTAFSAICLSGAASAEGIHKPIVDLVERNDAVIAAVAATGEGAPAIELEIAGFPAATPEAPLIDLGSITKVVTAVAVLTLVDGGQLGLDTTLAELMPDVPRDKGGITVHQLLTHTSGLVDSTGDDGERIGRAAFVARLMATPLDRAPGAGYAYSNAGYSLLAAIIETVSGQSYDAYLQSALIEPHGLVPIGYQAAYAEDRSLRSGRQALTGFRRLPIDRASWGGAEPGWNLIGNGGAVTTADGFLAFWTAFYQGRLVSSDLVALALTPHADEGDGTSFYGYGLVVEDTPDHGRTYWHDGGNEIFSAEWRHLSQQDAAYFVAALRNEAFDRMGEVMAAVAQ